MVPGWRILGGDGWWLLETMDEADIMHICQAHVEIALRWRMQIGWWFVLQHVSNTCSGNVQNIKFVPTVTPISSIWASPPQYHHIWSHYRIFQCWGLRHQIDLTQRPGSGHIKSFLNCADLEEEGVKYLCDLEGVLERGEHEWPLTEHRILANNKVSSGLQTPWESDKARA